MEAEELGGGDGRPPGCTGKVAVSIYRYFSHGGLQKNMMNTVLELRRRNLDVTIFCMSWESSVIPDGVTVRRLRLSGMTSASKAHKFDLALSRVLKKRSFDLHLSFNKVSGADCYFVDDMPFAGNPEKIPLWRRLFSRRYRIYSKMERQVFNKSCSATVFCLSPLQKRAYQAIYGTQENRFVIVPPGIGEQFRSALQFRELRRDNIRRELGVQEDEKMLLFVGSAFHTKGADRAIAALAALPAEAGINAKLFIAGQNDHEALDSFARRCGVDDRVFFLGGRTDIPELLAGADLLIHPARSEVTGIVLLEAISCGTPVLCTRNCGYSKLVEESGNPVLPHPFRQKLLNRTLMLTLSVPGKLDELQQEAALTGASGDFFRRFEVIADAIMEKLKRA